MSTSKPYFAPITYTPAAVLAAHADLDADDPLVPALRDPRTPDRPTKVAAIEDLFLVGWCETYSPIGIRSVSECRDRYLAIKRTQVARLGIHVRLLYTVGPNKSGYAHVHSLTECGWQLDREHINDVRDEFVEAYTAGHVDIRPYRYGGGWVRYIIDHADKTPHAETIAATMEVVCPGGPECVHGCRVRLDDPQFLDPRRYRAAGMPRSLAGNASTIRQQVVLQRGSANLPNVVHDATTVDLSETAPDTDAADIRTIEQVLIHLRAGHSQRAIADKLRMGRHRLRAITRAVDAAGLLDDDAPARVPLHVLRQIAPVDDSVASRSYLGAYEDEIRSLRSTGLSFGDIAMYLRRIHAPLATSERSVRRYYEALREREDRRSGRPTWAIIDGRQLRTRVRDDASGAWVRPWVLVMAIPSMGRAYAQAFPRLDGLSWSEFHRSAIRALGSIPERLSVAADAVADVRDRFRDDLPLREYSDLARLHGFTIYTKAVPPMAVSGLATDARRACRNAGSTDDVHRALTAWSSVAPAGIRLLAVGSPSTISAENLATWKRAKVQIDNHITFAGARYSVPAYLIGQHVEVSASSDRVAIYRDGEIVTEHPRKVGRRSTHPEHLVCAPLPAQLRAADTLRFRAARISAEAERDVNAILDSASFTIAHGRAQAAIARHRVAHRVVVDPPSKMDEESHRRRLVPATVPGVVRVQPATLAPEHAARLVAAFAE